MSFYEDPFFYQTPKILLWGRSFYPIAFYRRSNGTHPRARICRYALVLHQQPVREERPTIMVKLVSLAVLAFAGTAAAFAPTAVRTRAAVRVAPTMALK